MASKLVDALLQIAVELKRYNDANEPVTIKTREEADFGIANYDVDEEREQVREFLEAEEAKNSRRRTQAGSTGRST